MTASRILIVDDEAAIRRFLRVSLSAHGYQIHEAECGVRAIEKMVELRPDLLVLDLGLPDLDGVDVVKQVREWSRVPILVLSIRDQERDKVVALDAGADDYLTKPFGLGELLARVRAALRRGALPADSEPTFECEELCVDLVARRVKVGEREVQLTPTEYDLLRALVGHAGRVLTHHQLLTQVWGPHYSGENHLLRVNISNLRRKLEPDPVRPRYLVTEPGVGYRLRAE